MSEATRASSVEGHYATVIEASQRHFRRLRRLSEFYHRFAGALIRVQQDRDVDLVHISSGVSTIQLQFEQEDRDGLVVRIEPFRNDLVFVSKVGFWAEVQFRLFRLCADPDALQRVNAMQMKTQFGGLFGGGVRPKARARSGVTNLDQPGILEIQSAGSRVYVSTRLIMDLGRYMPDKDEGRFDRDAIARDLDAAAYGLEKVLEKVVQG